MRIFNISGLGLLFTFGMLPGCGGTSDDPRAAASGAEGDATSRAGSAGAADTAGMGGSGGAAGLLPSRLLGSACLPSAEWEASFAGFAASDVTVEEGSAYCAEGAVCLVDHFQGRVSCPYGEGADDASVNAPDCSIPGSAAPVSVRVEPQRLDRRAQDAVYCSCRCAGPDPTAEYCECDAGFECVERVPALVSGQNLAHVGSYCVRSADAEPNPVALSAATCEAGSGQCGTELGLPPSLPALVPTGPSPSTTTSPFLVPPGAPRKLDLLFMLDNSIGMAPAQELLARSVGELLERLANPLCVDATGNVHPAPAPGRSCPMGQTRQFEPYTDLHVGFITSSLADAGANMACPTAAADSPRFVADRNDQGHLLGSLPRGQNLGANSAGFLDWRAGETSFGDFSANARRLLRAAGENGCGWEQSLEAWYRFLVDPVPYRRLVRVPCAGTASTALNCVQPESDADNRIVLDEVLLAQRAAFLRPDSTLAIVMLSDENDCSLQQVNQTWVVVNTEDQRPFFRGSSACAQDPNDKCCYSCPLEPPEGCAVDPVCTSDAANANRLQPQQDAKNLRCFDQKRRFGYDFLNPTQRYVNALTQPMLCSSALDLGTTDCATEELRPNTLFEGGRNRSQIVLGGLLGVPWQALSAGVSPSGAPLPVTALRYKSAAELDVEGDPTWTEVLGSPGVPWRAATGTQPEVASVPRTPPTLPQMVESDVPRPGVIVGNPINGRDYDTAPAEDGSGPADLEPACIFPLPQPIDCAALDPTSDNCGCFAGSEASPICEQNPGISTAGTTQNWGKATPGLRQLQVLKDMEENAVVGSVCARNTSDPSRDDYGYRPAISALLERLQTAGVP